MNRVRFFLNIVLLCLFVVNVKAEQSSELAKGIDYFETGMFKEAISIFESQTGDSCDANYYLGLIYDPEFNRPPFSKNLNEFNLENERRVVKYYKTAADMGCPYALFQLGKYYRSIHHKRQNYRKSDVLFRKARKELQKYSEEGDWLSMYMLAVISGNSPSTETIGINALKHIRQKAESGDRFAQLYLGKALSQWLCRTEECKNYPEALAWFFVSAKSGSYHSKLHAINLIKLMSEEEQKSADTLTRNILKKFDSLK